MSEYLPGRGLQISHLANVILTLQPSHRWTPATLARQPLRLGVGPLPLTAPSFGWAAAVPGRPGVRHFPRVPALIREEWAVGTPTWELVTPPAAERFSWAAPASCTFLKNKDTLGSD